MRQKIFHLILSGAILTGSQQIHIFAFSVKVSEQMPWTPASVISVSKFEELKKVSHMTEIMTFAQCYGSGSRRAKMTQKKRKKS
jgi:hypothetical protein